MRLSKRPFFGVLALMSLLLGACSQNSPYGVYSFQMGDSKGTNFYVAMELDDKVGTPSIEPASSGDTFDYSSAYAPYMSADEGIVQREFIFEYELNSAASSSSVVTATSPAETATATTAPFIKEAETATGTSTETTTETATETTSEDSTSEESVAEDSNLKVEGLWSLGDVKADAKGVSHQYLRLEITNFVNKETDEKISAFIPAQFVDIVLKVYFNDDQHKAIIVEIPVSLDDAMASLMNALLNDDPTDAEKVHTVKVELDKEDSFIR
jgi:hypothetical protein